MVLFAGVEFTFIDVGSKGRLSDAYIFDNSNFGQRLQANKLDLPEIGPLYTGGEFFPYVFVGDAAFPLLQNLMRPYPKVHTKDVMETRIFNYKLSRACWNSCGQILYFCSTTENKRDYCRFTCKGYLLLAQLFER